MRGKPSRPHVKHADFGCRVSSSEINSALKSSTGQQVAPKIRLPEEGLKGAPLRAAGKGAAAPQDPPDAGRSVLRERGGIGPSAPGAGWGAALRERRAAAAFARLRGGRAGRGYPHHPPPSPPVLPHSPPRWEMCRQRKRCRLGRWSSPGHLRRSAEVRTYPPSVESR